MSRLGLATFVSTALGAGCAPYYNSGFLPRCGPVQSWTLVRRLPHDASSFTEGLAMAGGTLFESAGGYGDSRMLEVDSRDGRVLRERTWPGAIIGAAYYPFAEGVATDGEHVVQLSWKNGRAFTWTRDLRRQRDLRYRGEGWGLCYDGSGYWRSDGSARLHRHRSDSFAEDEHAALTVTSNGIEVDRLNELECFEGLIFANVWETPYVVIIRPADGHVIGALDFTALVHDADASGRESVLNGLAWDAARRELYVTGKHWSKLYVVQLNSIRQLVDSRPQPGRLRQ